MPAEGEPLVIRWSHPDVWGETGREHVRREASACRLLADSVVPIPRLLASNPDGEEAGGAANLLSWQAGSSRFDPLSLHAVQDLARVLVSVHQHAVPLDRRPPSFSYRGPSEPEVPVWARHPALWRRAIDQWKAGAPPTSFGVLHRDFHLGNIVWEGDRVTGVVDWAEISWGPPDVDVAHMCADFAMLHTMADVEHFRAAYRGHGGRLDPDPEAARFWLISDILGFLPDPAHILPGLASSRPDITADGVRHGLEDLLARTLA